MCILYYQYLLSLLILPFNPKTPQLNNPTIKRQRRKQGIYTCIYMYILAFISCTVIVSDLLPNTYYYYS